MALWLGVAALAAWLVLASTGFWACAQRDDTARTAAPPAWPRVVAVVPARNETDVIARSLASLASQDYPGEFRIIMVDDNSDDGTAAIAAALGSARIRVLSGAPLAAGWTGKLWALRQGIAAAGSPHYLWLTDADIEHAPDTLSRLVTIATAQNRALVSFMARLHCKGWAEAAIVPAFVWFFMMLYPFGWINRMGPISRKIAGAAGGCVLVEAEALAAAGGIAAMRAALIDDCTLGALIKRQGSPIWLGLTHRSRSIRPYRGLGEIGAMITRSAYAQLRYNPALLAATLAGLALMFAVPVALLAAQGLARVLGGATLVLMAALYQPILRFYRRSPLWAFALPLIGGFYAGCTLASAIAHWRGRGGMWKGRAQAPAGASAP